MTRRKPVFLYCADEIQLGITAFAISLRAGLRAIPVTTIPALMAAVLSSGPYIGCVVIFRSPKDKRDAFVGMSWCEASAKRLSQEVMAFA